MKHRKWVPFIVFGLVAALVTVGVINIRTASAAITTAEESSPILSLKGEFGREIGGYSKADLAEALGVTEENLEAAFQIARENAIAQGLEQGLITQAQADELASRDSGFRMDRALSAFMAQNGIDFQALLADALGITVEELSSAYEAATFARIDQAVEDGKITEEQAQLARGRYSLYRDETFKATMKSAFEGAIQAAVKSGVITQEQADLILESSSWQTLRSERGARDIFGLDLNRMRPGHGERGAVPETSENDTDVEP